MKKKHIGSSFDDWLREEGICEEVAISAIKRVLARQVAEAMKERRTKHDWRRFDAMTDAEVYAAALKDPDAQPLRSEDMKRMKRVPQVKVVRRALGLNQLSERDTLRVLALLKNPPRPTARLAVAAKAWEANRRKVATRDDHAKASPSRNR